MLANCAMQSTTTNTTLTALAWTAAGAALVASCWCGVQVEQKVEQKVAVNGRQLVAGCPRALGRMIKVETGEGVEGGEGLERGVGPGCG